VPDLIIGSSIGVCNSLVYVSGGADALWGFWSSAVSLPRVVDLSLSKNALFGNSFFSMDRLQRFVESEVDFDRCFRSEIDLTYVVTNLSAGHEEMRGNRTERTLEDFRTITRIGYAIPLLHPLIELNGDLYADGGFLWNVPFEYAEDWGATDIYVLSVVPSQLQRADSLRFVPQVAMRMYDVFWRTLGNSSYLEKRLVDGKYHGINVVHVEPSPETGMFDPLGMLNAHPAKSRRLLWDGYRDTERALHDRPRSGRVKASASPRPRGSKRT
jgi:predicted acylesterase/phospholipase RssA